MATDKKIETSTIIFEIKDDIIYIIIKADVDMDLDAIKEAVEARIKIQDNKKMLTLVDNRGIWQITKEANEYSSSKEVAELSIATAVLSDSSLPKRLMANFFIKFNKLHCPTKLFSSEEKAIEWLNTFKD